MTRILGGLSHANSHEPPATSIAPASVDDGAVTERRMEREQQLADVWAEFLIRLGTNLWRLRHKMIDPGTAQPIETMRRVFPQVESMWDDLAQLGVEVRDHTGEFVPEGGVFGLKIVALQPTPGINRETVVETIKPSVYFRGQTIQMGEVIVGTVDSGAAASTPAAPQPDAQRNREIPNELASSDSEAGANVPPKRALDSDDASDWSEANQLYQQGDSKP
jgi:hypothetical protein